MTWLFIPLSSAPASACLEKDCEPGSTTWASRIAPSATLSGKLTQPQSWLRVWKKAPWMQRLSGPTFSPSTLYAGVDAWISSLRDSRAKTSASRVGGPGLMAPAPDSSSTSSTTPTLAVRQDSFWRTSAASLLPPPPLWTKPKAISKSARLPASWENWPTAGGMRNGSLFQRLTWAPATDASGGSASPGAWLTPAGLAGLDHTGKAGAGGEFAQQATRWQSPQTSDGNGPREPDGKRSLGLNTQTTHWPTPDAGMYAGSNRSQSPGAAVRPAISLAATQWPTPGAAVIDAKAEPPVMEYRKATDPQIGLADVAVHCFEPSAPVSAWPTPAARDAKGPNSEAHVTTNGTGRMHMDQLANFVAYSPQVQQTPAGQPSSPSTPSSRRHLNPIFGAWLMGWPSAWVIAEPHASSALATESWRSALQQHLSCLLDEPASPVERLAA